MKPLWKRGMRLAVMTLGFAGLFVAVNAVPGAATPPNANFSSMVVARGTYIDHGSLRFKTGMDVVVTQIISKVGGSSGWHSHPGGAIAIIQQGEVTFYTPVANGDDHQGQGRSDEQGGGRHPNCVITRYTQGQSFVELPGQVGYAKNTGSIDTIIIATFPGVPVGVVGGQRIDQPDPGTCRI